MGNGKGKRYMCMRVTVAIAHVCVPLSVSLPLSSFVSVRMPRKRTAEQELSELLREKEEQIAGLMEEGTYTHVYYYGVHFTLGEGGSIVMDYL